MDSEMPSSDALIVLIKIDKSQSGLAENDFTAGELDQRWSSAAR